MKKIFFLSALCFGILMVSCQKETLPEEPVNQIKTATTKAVDRFTFSPANITLYASAPPFVTRTEKVTLLRNGEPWNGTQYLAIKDNGYTNYPKVTDYLSLGYVDGGGTGVFTVTLHPSGVRPGLSFVPQDFDGMVTYTPCCCDVVPLYVYIKQVYDGEELLP